MTEGRAEVADKFRIREGVMRTNYINRDEIIMVFYCKYNYSIN